MYRTQSTGNSQIDRYLVVLEALSPAPQYKTVEDVHSTLLQHGHKVDKRTVQRILQYYKGRYGLESRPRPGGAGKPPLEWAWPKKQGAPNFQPIDPPTALTFELAAQLLAPVVPGPFMEAMERDMRRARQTLAQTNPKASKLPRKLRVIPRGQGRLPNTVDPGILDAVFEATLAEKQIRVTYLAQSITTPNLSTHVLNPLGLVFRFDTFYLVHVRETKTRKPNARQVTEWPLHRFRGVEPLHTRIRVPQDFDLDRHLEQPGFMQNIFWKNVARLRPSFRLEILLTERTARYVRERPFSEDQQERFQDDGRVKVTATVRNTREMLTELLKFADDVEVVKPKALRDYFAEVAANLCERYGQPPSRGR